MEELWRPVDVYEGKYEVSNFRRVMSLNYSMQGEPAIRKLSLDKDGYLNVTLYSTGNPKTFKVHRLDTQSSLDACCRNEQSHHTGLIRRYVYDIR